MKDKENPKIRRIYLRVSEKDYNIIKHNSRHFQGLDDDRAMSHYIRQALIAYSNNYLDLKERKSIANSLLSFLKGYENALGRTAESIKKVSNRLLFMELGKDVDTEETNPIVAKAIMECMPTFEQCLEGIEILKARLKTAVHQAVKEQIGQEKPTEIKRLEPKN